MILILILILIRFLSLILIRFLTTFDHVNRTHSELSGPSRRGPPWTWHDWRPACAYWRRACRAPGRAPATRAARDTFYYANRTDSDEAASRLEQDVLIATNGIRPRTVMRRIARYKKYMTEPAALQMDVVQKYKDQVVQAAAASCASAGGPGECRDRSPADHPRSTADPDSDDRYTL